MADIIAQLRQPKIFDMAIFDWVATLVVAYIIAVLVHERLAVKPDKTRFIILTSVLAIILGIFVHIVMGIPTGLNYHLGLSQRPL